MSNLNENMDEIQLLEWVIDFIKCADFTGIVYNEVKVLNILHNMNFVEGANTSGFYKNKDHIWTSNEKLCYIMGQVILSIDVLGCPHPAIIHLCKDLLKELE